MSGAPEGRKDGTGTDEDIMRLTTRGLLLAAALAALPLPAVAECGLCARSVVVNSQLATCFLEKYPQLSAREGAAVAVDLEDCEQERGVVAPLRGPQAHAVVQPSMKFILSLAQLACLKQKLEQPGLALDPAVEIDLGAC